MTTTTSPGMMSYEKVGDIVSVSTESMWYTSFTESSTSDSGVLCAPPSSLLLAKEEQVGSGTYLYSIFPSYLEMMEYVERYPATTFYEVLTRKRFRKMFFSFSASSSVVALQVVSEICKQLDALCKEAYRGDVASLQQHGFASTDLRLYQSEEKWTVVDAARTYGGSRHISLLQKTIVPYISSVPGAMVADVSSLTQYVPLLYNTLLGKGPGGTYSLGGSSIYNTVPYARDFGTLLSPRHYEAGVLRDAYLTAPDALMKRQTHYFLPPHLHTPETGGIVLARQYYSHCNRDTQHKYCSEDKICSRVPYHCAICKEDHDTTYFTGIHYQSEEKKYYYYCANTTKPHQLYGMIIGNVCSVTLPVTEEEYEEYAISGHFSYPCPSEFRRDENTPFLGSGKREVTGAQGECGSYVTPTPTDGVGVKTQKWSQTRRTPPQTPHFKPETEQAARTSAYPDPNVQIPPLTLWMDSEYEVGDFWQQEGDVVTDVGAVINTLIELTEIATKIAYYYKLVDGNRIMNWYTRDVLKPSGSITVKMFLPSVYEAAMNAGKKPRPQIVKVSLPTLMSQRYLSLPQLAVNFNFDFPSPAAQYAAQRKYEVLLQLLEDHRSKAPYLPVRPSTTPYFYGERIPLKGPYDVNISRGFTCNPKIVEDPDLPADVRITTMFPMLRKLVLYGFCSGRPEMARILWAHTVYPLCHLEDPQTYKALAFGGPQGSMKSSWASNLRAVYGRAMVSVSPKDVCGNFNASLDGAMLVCIDEPPGATATRNYNDSSSYKETMKKIIAGDGVLAITNKNKDTRFVDNVANVIITTNHYNTGIMDEEDKRRFIVFSTRCLGITKDGVLITSTDESFTNPCIAETEEPITLGPDDNVDTVKLRFLEAYCEEVNQPTFGNEFARYLLDYGKVHDTAFIRNYVQPAGDSARAEMLIMSSTSSGEFFEDFLSDEYRIRTQPTSLVGRATPKKIIPEGGSSYYISCEDLYTEFQVWYRKKYSDNRPPIAKIFNQELVAWTSVRSDRITFHGRTKRTGDTRLPVIGSTTNQKEPTGIHFVSLASLLPGWVSTPKMAIVDNNLSSCSSPSPYLPTSSQIIPPPLTKSMYNPSPFPAITTIPANIAPIIVKTEPSLEIVELREMVKKQSEQMMMQQQAEQKREEQMRMQMQQLQQMMMQLMQTKQ